ncbi:unnamed protein product, partial [Meganyctiphanes norvegica]
STWSDECHTYICGKDGVESTFLSNKCCKVDGEVKTDGETWKIPCNRTKNTQKVTCNHGQLISVTVHTECCHDKKTDFYYKYGEKWRSVCQDHTCINGETDTKTDPDCCERNGEFYLNTEMFKDNCKTWTCAEGSLELTIDPRCCTYNGKQYTNGQTWEEECKEMTCNNGQVETSENSSCK